MTVEVVTIVDLADQVVSSRPRPEIRQFGLTYRVTYILVFNAAGQLLIQKRTDIKDWCPGRFDLAAGGIIQYDESYALSAERELEEELGITPPLKAEFSLFTMIWSRRSRTETGAGFTPVFTKVRSYYNPKKWQKRNSSVSRKPLHCPMKV